MDEVLFLRNVPTVEVKNWKKNVGTRSLIINEEDFDPDFHECLRSEDQERLMQKANTSGAKTRARSINKKIETKVETEKVETTEDEKPNVVRAKRGK